MKNKPIIILEFSMDDLIAIDPKFKDISPEKYKQIAERLQEAFNEDVGTIAAGKHCVGFQSILAATIEDIEEE